MLQTTNTAAPGLSSHEAQQRLRQSGPNAVPQKQTAPLMVFLSKLWGPVPWMLEATILLQLFLGRYLDVIITSALLLVNAALSFAQEDRAQKALALLRQGLTIQSRVLRDGRWQLVPIQELVPGDVVRVRVGDIVPADLRLFDGQISADQSALTGESMPADITAGSTAYSGSTVKRGEGTGEVIATGTRTNYGKTAELVQTAQTASHMDALIQTIVKYLVLMNGILIALIVVYALVNNLPLSDLLPFILILLVASVPVAMPATFTLASALGSLELSKRGVLVTRLSAIREAAGMDVLCTDKTGTITLNQLAVSTVEVFSSHTEDELLKYAAISSDVATQDPIDVAILKAVHDRKLDTDLPSRLNFIPFDPLTKRTEATIRQGEQTLRLIKGFPPTVIAMTHNQIEPTDHVEHMAAQGNRVIAVATGIGDTLELIGLIGLQDPPRHDSQDVIAKVRDMGVKIIMITGDSLETAQAVATQIGINGQVCPAEKISGHSDESIIECDVFAGVFPEDKFKLVQKLQHKGYVVGMTGDGVNDAPALKQAEVGMAVANATDVAKAAASLVLTNPGLSDMLAAIEVGRRIYQRILTYTLNKIVKTFQIGMFLGLGLLLTGVLITRPLLILLLLFANDFVTMSIATDNVSISVKPDHWNIRQLVISSLVLSLAWLIFSFGVLLVGRNILLLPLNQLQTFIFILLVFSGQANVYLVRERSHFWHSRPSRWLALGTVVDVLVVSVLAIQGILMTPIPLSLVAGLFIAIIPYMGLVDMIKVPVFKRLM